MYYNGSAIYVANVGPVENQILVFWPYANGNVKPVRTIGGPLTQMPLPGEILGIVIDSHGYLYVAYGVVGGAGERILVFAPFANGNVAPVRVIKGSKTELAAYRGMDVDSKGRLYVASNGLTLKHGQILVFESGANGNVAPIHRIIPSPPAKWENVMAVAVGKSVVYVSSVGPFWEQIDLFPLSANGVTVPTCTMGGAASGIPNGNVRGLTAAPYDGTVWALMEEPSDTTWTLRAYHDCDSAPGAAIGGANTGFQMPMGVAFDAKGFLYVSNLANSPGDSSVPIFAPNNQNGNVAPTFVIQGPNTQFNALVGVAIGP